MRKKLTKYKKIIIFLHFLRGIILRGSQWFGIWGKQGQLAGAKEKACIIKYKTVSVR